MHSSSDASRSFFDEGSPYLSHPLLTPERTVREINAIEKLVGPITGETLDVGCGFGRHSIELARRGVRVSAIDPSSTMVNATRAGANAEGIELDVRQASAEQLSDTARFDLALCLFTTFGQRTPTSTDMSGASDRAVLTNIQRALRPDGVLILELPDKDRAVAGLIEQEQLGPTHVTRSFDEATALMRERFVLDSGVTFDLAFRLFSQTELEHLVETCGFLIEHVQPSALVEPPTTFMTLVAHRAAAPSDSS